MGKSYSEKLKDERWKKKRLEILKRDNFTCQGCETTNKPLHVHHGFYDYSYKNPWDYPSVSLWTLCKDCHNRAHTIIHDINIEISKINPLDLSDLIMKIHKFRVKKSDRAHQKEYCPTNDEWV